MDTYVENEVQSFVKLLSQNNNQKELDLEHKVDYALTRVLRPKRHSYSENPDRPPPMRPRTFSERIRAGEIRDEIDSRELQSLIHYLDQQDEGNRNEENKVDQNPRIANYIQVAGPSANFEEMLKNHEERKKLFYDKFSDHRALSMKKGKTIVEKIDELRKKLEICKISFTQGSNIIKVQRDKLYEESFAQFIGMDHQKELKVVFNGEMKAFGQDAGGMEKEWFTLISQEFLNPENGLFRKTSTDEISYVIEEQSSKIIDFEKRFEFFGLVMAKAIFDEIPLNLCLHKLMYRFLLDPDCTIELNDIKDYDSSVYNSLKYIRDNNISEDENIELYFSHEFNGKMYPLVPDGENIQVDEDNKESFITLKTEFMVKSFIDDQISAIIRGFEKLISLKHLNEFSDKEFSYLCCGEDSINIEDWQNNTVYSGDYSNDHYLIKWFWSYMEELDQSSLSVIFQFVTGMSRLPAGGFNSLNQNRGEKQYFNIRSVPYNSQDPYPKAFTCFNRFHLPIYPSIDILKEYMNALIQQKEVYGFGLED